MKRIPTSAKLYGSARTHLSLTRKAAALYADTDPLDIYEVVLDADDPDEDPTYTYYVRGCYLLDGVTEDDLNEYLESVYDEMEEEKNDDET